MDAHSECEKFINFVGAEVYYHDQSYNVFKQGKQSLIKQSPDIYYYYHFI